MNFFRTQCSDHFSILQELLEKKQELREKELQLRELEAQISGTRVLSDPSANKAKLSGSMIQKNMGVRADLDLIKGSLNSSGKQK